MKKLLIPIDFSAYSECASKAGVFYARQMNAKLYLLHVIFGPMDWESTSVESQQEHPEIEGHLVEAQIKLEKFSSDAIFQGMEVYTHVGVGVAYNEILRFAGNHHIDMIVMGAHGLGESHAKFIGSTAQRVVRSANCPVLSIKRNFESKPIKTILFPSDFKEDVRPAFEHVKNIADEMKAQINLLYINTPENFADNESMMEKMKNISNGQNGFRFHQFIYNDFDKEKGILHFTKDHKADMIVMVTHCRKAKPCYQLGITETLLFHAEVPVMSIVL